MTELRAQPGSPGGRGHPTLRAEQIPSCGGQNGDGGSSVREMLSGSLGRCRKGSQDREWPPGAGRGEFSPGASRDEGTPADTLVSV